MIPQLTRSNVNFWHLDQTFVEIVFTLIPQVISGSELAKYCQHQTSFWSKPIKLAWSGWKHSSTIHSGTLASSMTESNVSVSNIHHIFLCVGSEQAITCQKLRFSELTENDILTAVVECKQYSQKVSEVEFPCMAGPVLQWVLPKPSGEPGSTREGPGVAERAWNLARMDKSMRNPAWKSANFFWKSSSLCPYIVQASLWIC